MHLRILLTLLIFSSQSFGAVTPAGITIDQAIKKGLDYSPDIKKAQGTLQEASANLSKARGLFFPTINGIGQATTHQNSTTSNSSSLPTSISSSTGDIYLLGLTLSQPLYAGGALTAGLSYYKTNEAIAKQAYFSAKQTLLSSLISAYYSLVQAEMTLEAAQANRDILKSYVDITTHYAHIGRSRKMDEMQSQANYSLALVDVEQLQSNLNSAQANINRYIGESKSAQVKSDFRVTISPIGNLTPQEALESAIKNNPTVLSDKLNVENVDYSKSLDLSQDMPSLNLSATAGYQSPDVPNLWQGSSKYYTAGLTLTVPIFSGLSSLSKRSIYGAKSYQAEKQLQSDSDNLRVQIETALNSLHSTQNQLDIAVKAVKVARNALDLANRAYKDGTASSTDVANLQQTRYNSEKIFITAQFAYLTSLLNLRQQMGIDLEKAYGH